MRRPSEEVVDGQVVGYGDVPMYSPPPGRTVTIPSNPTTTSSPPVLSVPPPAIDPSSQFMLTADARGRAVTLFIEVPVLAVVALHPGVGGLVRLAAAGLALFRISQLAGPQDELQILGPG